MTIRVLSSLVGQDDLGAFSYGQGVHENVPEKRALELIRANHAIQVDGLPEIPEARSEKTEKRKK